MNKFQLCLASFGSLYMAQGAMAQTEQKKNLLFIITDQQRYDALSRAGNTVLETPNLDRLAAQGAYFKNAYTPCAVSGPARSCILTGYSVETTGVSSNEYTYYNVPEGVMTMPTFDEILSENGYHCEYYGKWHAASSHTDIYQNPTKVASNGRSIFGSGGQSHIWRDELATLGTIPPPGDGQFIDGMSKWPYIADPLDRYYGQTQAYLDQNNLKHSQPDQHGELLLDKDYTLTAFQAKQTIEAIERLKDETFSITCSFHFPHSPMVLPEPYYSMYNPDDMPIPQSINDDMLNSPYKTSNGRERYTEYADPDKIKYMISNYYGLVKEIDDWVGKILDKVEELGLDDNTIIIFTSDHGEMLGAHGMREKNVFYEESAHIPLLISAPGDIPANTQVDGYVSLIDLFPTILDYTGTETHESEGKSLRGLIEGTDNEHGKYVVTEWDRGDDTPAYMVVQDGWKLIIPYTIKSDVINALYDLNTDPYEQNNLLGNNPNKADYIDKAEELRASLVEWLQNINSKHLYSVQHRDLLNGGKPTGNNASFVSQDVPELIPGETLTVSITMKNTGSTTWIPGGNFKLGSRGPADNTTWGLSRIELNEGESIAPTEEKVFTFTITVPETDGSYNFQWQMVQDGEEWFGAMSSIEQLTIGNPGSYLDFCDELTDWKSSQALQINSTDQRQGSGCIEFSGSGTDEYKKTFDTPYEVKGDPENVVLKFWYYVSDPEKFDNSNQVEIGSAGRPDQDEYNWSLNNLSAGWNYIELKISDANKTGNPDLSAINWFRIYHKKVGELTTRIDAIQIIDPNLVAHSVTVINGSGGDNHYQGENVFISANPAPEGKEFDEWVVNVGSPSIVGVNSSTAMLIMTNEDITVTATYKDLPKHSLTIYKGSGAGNYYDGEEVTISAIEPAEGEQFSSWVVESGSVTIEDVSSATTTVTMGSDDAVVTAQYTTLSSIFNQNTKSIKIFPNPLNGNKLTIVLGDFSSATNIEVKITDLLGQTVYCENFENQKTVEIDANCFLRKTVYLVTIKSENRISTAKLMVE